MSEVVLKPSADDVRKAGVQFDSANKVLEEALRDLFTRYPYNRQTAHVLLKATVLNSLRSTLIPVSSTHVPTIFDVADHIQNLSIDSELSQGDEGLVRRVAAIEVRAKYPRFYYEFATKYCSWHNPRAYPIIDSPVVEYLWYLQYHDCLDRFHQADLWHYPQFKRIVEEFKTRNGLGRFTFKAIDKFLRLQGALLLGDSGKRIEDETILVPVPGQPGEMEWSVENYSSPEDAERSRERWTEYAPPIIVVPPPGEGEK